MPPIWISHFLGVFLYFNTNPFLNLIMKKIFTLIAAFLMLAAVNAIAQPSVGGGFFSSTEIVKSGNTSSESNPMSGFYAGLGYTIPVLDELSFTPGVYYGILFKNSSTSYGPFSINGKRQDHFINVPLHLSYGIDLSSALRFFVYGGPTASIAVASKVTNTGSVSNVGSTSKSYDRYEEDSNLQRFDVLLGVGAGIMVNEMIRFQAGYDFGMLNRYNTNNYALKRNQFTVGIAFLF